MHNKSDKKTTIIFLIKTICISALAIVVNKRLFTRSRKYRKSFKNTSTQLLNLIRDFFMFSKTIASVSANIFPSVTGTNGKSFCFCPEMNSERISRAEQPIKLRGKHYPPHEYS